MRAPDSIVPSSHCVPILSYTAAGGTTLVPVDVSNTIGKLSGPSGPLMPQLMRKNPLLASIGTMRVHERSRSMSDFVPVRSSYNARRPWPPAHPTRWSPSAAAAMTPRTSTTFFGWLTAAAAGCAARSSAPARNSATRLIA